MSQTPTPPLAGPKQLPPCSTSHRPVRPQVPSTSTSVTPRLDSPRSQSQPSNQHFTPTNVPRWAMPTILLDDPLPVPQQPALAQAGGSARTAPGQVKCPPHPTLPQVSTQSPRPLADTITAYPMPAPSCPVSGRLAGTHTTSRPRIPDNNSGPNQVNNTVSQIDFQAIRDWCELTHPTDHNVNPHHLAHHRRETWPDINPQAPGSIVQIYSAVKATGLPNFLGARIQLPTDIKIESWRELATNSKEDVQLLDMIQFGFPLGYNGPITNTSEPINHQSANQFPNDISQFIAEEKAHGALIGPFNDSIFDQWQHVSPMMTRPKADPTKRRIITDLSFPPQQSVNAYIKKNCSTGEDRVHSLPTVQNVVDHIQAMGPGVTLFTIDVNRAYKNFRACPLDWPLLNIMWPDETGRPQFYMDTAMPFGARLSSLHFQRVADFIVRALMREGITACMYLDDLIVIAPDAITAYIQFDRVRDMFKALGLPEAVAKTQPPSHKVTFLGIEINTRDMTLAITKQKVAQTLDEVKKTLRRNKISRRQFQSILGRLLHVAKCVPPARLFVSRMLDCFRCPGATHHKVNDHMRQDLHWFLAYLKKWNGVSIIPHPKPTTTITTDACMKGIGATDGKQAYAAQLSSLVTDQFSITEIEGFNV